MKDALGHGSNAHGAGIAKLAPMALPPVRAKVPMTQQALERLDIDTLDKSAFGYKSGDMVTVSPAKLHLQYPGDVANPRDKFAKGGMEWARSVDLSEPIDIDIKQDGKMYIADGHHRWFAASKTGRMLTGKIEVKAKPIPVIIKRGYL